MNSFDYFIEDYFSQDFKYLKSFLLPRNSVQERFLILANKIEFMLQNSSRCFEKVFSTTDSDREEFSDGVTIYKLKNGKEAFDIYFIQGCYDSDMSGSQDDDCAPLYRRAIPTIPINMKEKGVKGFAIYVTLLHLYKTLNNLTLNEAVNNLAAKMGVTINSYLTPKPAIIPVDIHELMPIKELPYRSNIFSYANKSGTSSSNIYVKYTPHNKIMIPFTKIQAGDSVRQTWCACQRLMDNNSIPLFNSWLLASAKIVIITDSIEISDINQRFINSNRVADIVWISWWPQDTPPSGNDWTLLNGKRVYYLLKEHSGLGGSQVYQKAKEVEQKLVKIAKSFKFVSYLANGIHSKKQSDTARPLPVIYTPEEFEAAVSLNPASLSDFIQLKNDLSNLSRTHKELVISPLIYSRTVTLISGSQLSGKTWLALSLAFGVSTGTRAFEGWCSGRKATPVLYLHGEDYGCHSFRDKLEIMGEIFAGRNGAPAEVVNLPFVESGQLEQAPAFGTFYWKAVDNNEDYEDNQIAKFVREYTDATNMNNADPKVLILDNLFSNSISSFTEQNHLVRELKTKGWTIIIVATSGAKIQLGRLIKDGSIKVNTGKAANGTLTISASTASSFCTDEKLKCRIDFNASPPTLVRLKERPRKWAEPLLKPRDQLEKEVKCLFNNGYKGKAIAAELGISLSMVKKLKRKLGLSKKRQPKRPSIEIKTEGLPSDAD